MALLEGISTRGGLILASGRISSEMLFKAAIMGVPIVGSRTSPTNLALGRRRTLEHHRVRLPSPGQHERVHPSRANSGAVNSPGGYVYILYGDDTFGRDEAVQSLKDRMRALPAGEHNLTELGPETTVAALRMAADVVPFLADRRMVIVYGLIGRLTGRGSGAAPTAARSQEARLATLARTSSRCCSSTCPTCPRRRRWCSSRTAGWRPEPLVAVIPRGRSAARGYPRVVDVPGGYAVAPSSIGVDLDETAVRELASARRLPTCAAWTASCASWPTTPTADGDAD